MSLDVLMRELAVLGPNERSRVMAFLVSLQDEQNVAHRAELARKIDDRDPARWIALENLDRRAGPEK